MAAMTTETVSPFATNTITVRFKGRAVRVAVSDVADPGAPHWTGLPLLLVPPYRSAVDAWLPVRLRLHAAGVRTICIDAAADYPGWFATAATLADFWMACLDELHVQQVDLAVWSWSGFMAQQFALDHGHRVRRRVMMAPGMIGPMTTPWPTLAWLSFVPRGRFPALDALFLYAGGAIADPHALAAVEAPSNWKAQWLQSTAAVTGHFSPRIHHPTLVLFAHDDPLVGAGVMYFWYRLWGPVATFVEIPQGGHAFPFLNPDQVAGLVIAHLRGQVIQARPPRLTEAAVEYSRQLIRLGWLPVTFWSHVWR